MKHNPFVSVIMNCFNCEKYLKEALESVLSQRYQNLEIIFWDNQSTDDSKEILSSYEDKRINYFYASSFTPLGKARNLAISKAKGEWIAFLDTDDIWDLNKLRFSFEELYSQKKIEDIALIYSRTNAIDYNKNLLYTIDNSPSGYIHDELLIKENFIVFSSIIVNKKVLNDIGKIEENLKYCEDLDLLLKITKEKKAIGLDSYLTSYRVHENNITTTKRYDNDIETIKFLEKYIIKNEVNRQIKRDVYINNLYRIGSLFIKLFINKEYINMGRLLKRNSLSLFLSPFAIVYKKLGY